jgi:hypothetical protein
VVLDQGRTERRDQKSELYGRALVVIAAEQHATRLVSSSQRGPSTRWSSHKDLAAKALRKLAGPHVPASLTRLEQSVKRAHSAFDKAERAHHEHRHAERQVGEAADADTDVGLVEEELDEDLADVA